MAVFGSITRRKFITSAEADRVTLPDRIIKLFGIFGTVGSSGLSFAARFLPFK
jgi:hypothetical protein